MLKDMIESLALSVFNKMAAPLADQVRELCSENEELRARVAKLEERPDPFDVRKYIDERLEDLKTSFSPPSADEVAIAISDRALAKALDRIDFQSELGEKASDWMSEQDWSSEANDAIKEWANDEDLEEKILERITDKIKAAFND